MIGRRQTLFVVALVLLALIGVGALLYLQRVPVLAPAPARPAATAGWYELHFTTPGSGGIDGELVELVDSARLSIDAAVYDFDLQNVAEALARAKARGVRVRFVTDSDTLQNRDEAIQRARAVLTRAEIPIVDDQRGPIMHHKFMVVDGEWVWTGSTNWTTGDVYRLNNNAIKLQSRELADNYTAEFEKMFAQRRFGPNKPRGVPNPRVLIEGVSIETYFAPQDRVSPRIVERINGANSSIDFLAFSFTHDAIGRAVIDKGKAGVKVRGVFETTGSQTQFSEYGRMRDAGLEVYQDGNQYVMHHKVVVLDRRTVIFGSYNFSSNADTDNDENLLVVDDPTMAEAFTGEVERMIGAAKARRR